MGKKRRRTSNQRDDTWTKGPEKPADAARRLKCAQRFETYYRQQLGLDDEEWRRMMATFRKPLPATFRVTAPDGLARKIERELREVCSRCDPASVWRVQCNNELTHRCDAALRGVPWRQWRCPHAEGWRRRPCSETVS